MDNRGVAILSTWLGIAMIAAFYMWVFGNKIGDVLFGVFLPVGLLVIVAISVTIQISSIPEPERELSRGNAR